MSEGAPKAPPGYLLLEDGRRFNGLLLGGALGGLPASDDAPGIGEVVFQTGMTGYQEVITDPSYRGQIVTFTASHIGNTGMNAFDSEAAAPVLAGIVTRSVPERPSSWRSEESLVDCLTRHGIPCLTEVDTRALTRHLRESGALRGVLAPIWLLLLVLVPLSLLALTITGFAWATRAGPESPAPRRSSCRNCRQEMEADWRLCPYCGEEG